jgi:hypothetical protein
MKILFLDIDGVLNDRIPFPNGYCGIQADKMTRLNTILAASGAKVVISSSWRYLVHGQAMTLQGFRYMMITHGLLGEVIGVTEPDPCIDSSRGLEISHWLYENSHWLCMNPVDQYLVLDDQDLDITGCGHPFLKIDGTVGLTDDHVQQAIAILGAGKGS